MTSRFPSGRVRPPDGARPLPVPLARTHILITDDFGLARLSAENHRDLGEVIEDRPAPRSTIINSQLPVDKWEAGHPDTRQIELPRYVGGRSIAVCWRTRNGPVTPYYFQDEAQNAADWLHYLETTYPAERENALLLVGVTETTATQRLLQLTHPLFTGARVLDPRHWMPPLPS